MASPPPPILTSGLRENEHGLWEAFIDGELVARVKTCREAFECYSAEVDDRTKKVEDAAYEAELVAAYERRPKDGDKVEKKADA